MRRVTILASFLAIAIGVATLGNGQTAEAQPVCFNETGFCINNPSFLGYFNARGGTNAFGFPISREFTFIGFRVQFFQGHIMQIMPNGSVATMNLLDEGLMPVSNVNGSTFPASDSALVAETPITGDPSYATKIVDFIRTNAPNDFQGRPVRFFDKFITTVELATAFPGGGGNAALVPLLNLEIWGSVTSRPMVDPTNPGFIYQRFQRSIMHYRDSCQCTERILLADWFKTVITGQGLPGDLQQEMANSRFLYQWNPSAPNWVARPDQLQNTDMTNAFVPDLPGFATPPAAPGVSGVPSGPTATPSTSGALAVKLDLSDTRVNPGDTFTVTVQASADGGVGSIWWWATSTDDQDLKDTHTFDCNGATPCRNSWDESTTDTGTITIHARAMDAKGNQSPEVATDLRVREAGATATPTASATSTTGATATATKTTP